MSQSLDLANLDPETLRRLHAEADAARVLQELPEGRRERVAALASRFDLFAPATLKIRTKDGGPLWPFVLNPIQTRYLNHLRQHYARKAGIDSFRGIRDLIVKPRQLGFSTFIGGLFFMDGYLSPGRVTVVLTHKRDLSQELLRTYKLFMESLPPKLQSLVVENTSSKYELELEFKRGRADDPPSRFIIATEAGEPWRGGVIHNLHASEAAWYKGWSGFKASFVQAVPKDGNICYETTVNSFNPYYDAVQDALGGKSTDQVVFYPWFEHPEYVLPWDKARQAPLTPEECQAMATFGLSLEQIAWRRWKQGEVKELFPQEYPETLLGAFLSSGRPFFDLGAVQEGHEAAKQSPAPKEPANGVQVWEDPIPGELYLLSADVAEGLDRGTTGSDPEQGGADFSRAYVLRAAGQGLRVVTAIGGRIRPVDFAKLLDRVGRAYQACVAVERNNHGHTVLAALEVSGYPEVYRHREYNQGTMSAFLVPGFPTNVTTRPMILDALDETIRRRALACPDARFWLECHSFQRNEKGKPEAMSGKHDDRVMSMAIGAYLWTLGRSGWNAGGADGADGAGFPRAQKAVEVPATGPAPEVRVHRIESEELADLLAEVHGSRRDPVLSCGTCHHFNAVRGFCDALLCSVAAGMPPCDTYVARDEEATLAPSGFDLEGEESPWT